MGWEGIWGWLWSGVWGGYEPEGDGAAVPTPAVVAITRTTRARAISIARTTSS